jgi:flagellar hook-associated protein 2
MVASATRVDGIVSGIDTTALIDAIVKASSAQKTLVSKRVDVYQDKSDKLTEVMSKLGDVQDALEDMQFSTGFLSYKATYAENSAVDVTAGAGSVTGTYEIEVQALAKAEVNKSQGFASKTDTGVLSTGTMDVTYNGTTTTLTLDGSTTLSSLANDLNEIDGISAYVSDTGDATNPYVLVVKGSNTGADYGITLDTSLLSGGTTPTFTETTTAQDAEMTIDGNTVTSASNDVTDAIPGVTFTLKDESTSALTVTVATDTDGIEEKINAFVDAYNAAIDYIRENLDYDADKGIKDAFVGESVIRSVTRGMLSEIGKAFTALGQDYDSVGLVGINSDGLGKLTFDTTAFEEAFAAEPDQVTDLFTSPDGFVNSMLDRLDLYLDTTDGSLQARQDTIEARIEDMNEQIDAYTLRQDKLEIRLRKQFDSMEAILGTLQSTSSYVSTLLASLTNTSS